MKYAKGKQETLTFKHGVFAISKFFNGFVVCHVVLYIQMKNKDKG